MGVIRLGLGALVVGVALYASSAHADTVYLSDGSVLKGSVISMSADELHLKTRFSDDLVVPRDQIDGLASDGELPLRLESGEEVQGQFVYEPEQGGQSIHIDGRSVPSGSKPEDVLASVAEVAPQVVAAQADDDEYELPEADALPPEDADYWSGRFELAINGNSGNTDSSSLLTEVSALRDTGDKRLSLSASVDREEEDEEQTAEEYLGKARYEQDITRRIFWFAQQQLEKDEFEDIDLRSRTLFGPGFFLARRDRLTFKVRSGLGYQYEAYTDDSESSELIFSAGWDYAQLVGEWMKLTHEFTIFPEVSNSPSENFVLESAFGVEVPIANSAVWRIRGALDHEYNNNPEPGVEELDTSYQVGVIRDF
ncbi:DUF481 domain-containing protein [Salinisphaera dokdonensis]|uniref:DUF481 domain-containing protein n=1 Tax=Salinisphaera dokdonensis TaxID=454598 RepID=UPI0033417559